MTDTIEPTECWVLTIPCGIDLADPNVWNTYAVTVEVYLSFDEYSARADELKDAGVVGHVRHLMAGKRYW